MNPILAAPFLIVITCVKASQKHSLSWALRFPLRPPMFASQRRKYRRLAKLISVALLLLAAPTRGAADSSTPGVRIKGPIPWIDVMAYGAKGDGTTDDYTSIQNAINDCPHSTNYGCTVFFPLGSYKLGTGLVIDTSHQGVTLQGECAVTGVGGSQTPCSRLQSGQGGTTGLVILTVGDGTNLYEGFRISNLAFNDGSTTGILAGAVQLLRTEHFLVDSIFCSNFRGGYCLSPSGGTSTNTVTQYGTIIHLVTTNTKFPIQANNKTSSINLYGGDIQCGLSSPGTNHSIGMDIGYNNPVTFNDNDGGEWGAFGTHILNCDTAIALRSSAGFQDYAVLEQTGSYNNSGTGVVIDVISGKDHTAGTVIAGSMSQFVNGVVLNANVDSITLSASFNSVSAPFYGGGDSGAEAKAVVLSADPGVPIGAQIPTDLTFVNESAPSVSRSGTGLQYFDSTALVFKESRNGGAFGFRGFAPSTGLASNHIVQGSNGTGDLADSGFTFVAAGSAGTGPANQGTSTAVARSDHDHRSIESLTWFFTGAGAGTTGVKNQTMALPDSISNIAVLDFRVIADSTVSGSTTYNLQKCTASCTGASPTFSNIYSTDLTLSANTRTASKGSGPDSITTFAAADQFKFNVTSANASIANVTVIMTYKCNTTN
jgi:hypothetical protein